MEYLAEVIKYMLLLGLVGLVGFGGSYVIGVVNGKLQRYNDGAKKSP